MKTRNWLTLGVVAALAAGTLALAGCGSSATDTTGTTTGSTGGELSGVLTVAGSDTMVNMAQGWAKGFMAANPNVQIAVKGGGSGTGITALINGQVDFADASREMKPEEIAQLEAKGGKAVATKVARDGVAIIVNASNGVENLNLDQLGRIYLGEITNWKQVGGADKPISLISRDPSSGTYEFMTGKALKGGKFAASAKLLASTQAIVDEVSANPDAIGYIGVGYESSKIKVIGVDGVKASVASVVDGTYPLSRFLFMYSNGDPKDLGKAYIDWILSAAGQKVVTTEGFVPVD